MADSIFFEASKYVNLSNGPNTEKTITPSTLTNNDFFLITSLIILFTLFLFTASLKNFFEIDISNPGASDSLKNNLKYSLEVIKTRDLKFCLEEDKLCA